VKVEMSKEQGSTISLQASVHLGALVTGTIEDEEEEFCPNAGHEGIQKNRGTAPLIPKLRT
jgi:hypothetical protein